MGIGYYLMPLVLDRFESVKLSPIGPIFRHFLNLIPDFRIDALLRERVHTLRLPAVKLSFCSWHWSGPHNGGGDGHPLNRGAGRELILGGL